MAVAFAEVHRNAVISLTERLHKVCHLSWAVSGVVGASARALRRERGAPQTAPPGATEWGYAWEREGST